MVNMGKHSDVRAERERLHHDVDAQSPQYIDPTESMWKFKSELMQGVVEELWLLAIPSCAYP
jgi:hypothetical protein